MCSSYFQKISVVNNMIHIINDDAFDGLSSLILLILINCKLRQMPPVNTVKDTLQLLNVRGNAITEIPQRYFEDFTSLKQLFISNNKLMEIPDVSPARCTLQGVKLSFNNITSIPSSLFDHIYPFLTSVWLSRNKIKTIPTGLLSAWPKIQVFGIDRNKLNRIDKYLFDDGNGTSYVEIHLLHNPWRCDSALSWFAELNIESHKDMYGTLLSYGIYGRWHFRSYAAMVCAEPQAYAGKRIKDVGTCMIIY